MSLYCAHLHQVLKVSLMSKLALNLIKKIINFVILKAACFLIDNNFCWFFFSLLWQKVSWLISVRKLTMFPSWWTSQLRQVANEPRKWLKWSWKRSEKTSLVKKIKSNHFSSCLIYCCTCLHRSDMFLQLNKDITLLHLFCFRSTCW